MPNLGLNNIEAVAISGEGFRKLPAGAYVCKIVDVMPEPANERVWFVIDIAEGEYSGYYADAYGIGHPNAHRLLLSYRTTGDDEKDARIFGMLKGRLQVIDECNPGFDSVAAFEADKWEMFNSRLIGLVVGEQQYTSNSGELRTKPDWFHARWRNLDAINSGKCKIPELLDENGNKVADAPQMPAVPERGAVHIYDDDIPFD